MKYHISTFVKNPLISGGFFMMAGAAIGNVFNFLFNLFMSRNLSVVEYGVLASLLSLMMIPSVFTGTVTPTIVNFAASYFAKNQLDHIRGLFLQFGKLSLLFGLLVCLLFSVFAPQIGEFFKISESLLIVLAALTVFVGFMSVINFSLLQAKLAFRFITLINFFSLLFKFLLGAALVLLGFGVAGAMIGILISSLITLTMTFIPLREVWRIETKSIKISFKEVFQYGLPATVIIFSLTSFVTTDIILVKHFFSPEEAGLYAGLSLVGRVIFFLTAPINTVVFPLIAQKYTRQESYRNTVLLAMSLVLLASIFLTGFYVYFPSFVVETFLKNTDYLQIVPYVSIFALLISLYSLLYLISNVFLALKNTKIATPLALGAALQMFFIWIHHETILQIITISSTIIFFLLVMLMVYYIRLRKV